MDQKIVNEINNVQCPNQSFLGKNKFFIGKYGGII